MDTIIWATLGSIFLALGVGVTAWWAYCQVRALFSAVTGRWEPKQLRRAPLEQDSAGDSSL
jgi:hypothetical protein